MNLPVQITLACAGIFLMTGLITGIMKYWGMMNNPKHRASYYIDTAHRAALMYSFAALVMAELLRYSPYPEAVQMVITAVPLFFFAVAIAQYIALGIRNQTSNQFKTRNFNTTWGMLLLIVGEVGGVGAIVVGFIQSQFL